jgi:hypothetical protein
MHYEVINLGTNDNPQLLIWVQIVPQLKNKIPS